MERPSKTILKNTDYYKEGFTRLLTFSSTYIHIQNNNSGKLNFLKDIKDTYTIEKYLKIYNMKNRLALTNLRTSNHTFAIETGRWATTDRENRLYVNQCTEH